MEYAECEVWKMRSVEKNPVFDGRVLIDLGTYHSLNEGQREMLTEETWTSLIHDNATCIDFNSYLPKYGLM